MNRVLKAASLASLLYTPPTAPPPDGWPLVLFLHGSGERGHDLKLVEREGPPRHVRDGGQYPFVLLSPQCPLEVRWDAHLDNLNELLRFAAERFEVDPRRVYATGLSMGGQGAWQLAARHPASLAAIAPICGRTDPRDAARIGRLPCWAFHGAHDERVPVRETEQMIEALQAVGATPRVTVYPDAGHFDVWDRAYADPELWSWLLRQGRETAVATPD